MDVVSNAGIWQAGQRKQRRLPLHRNIGLEIVCVVGGCAHWQIDGTRYRVESGSTFFTWPWEYHGGVREAQPGLELVFAIIQLDREYRRRPRRFGWHRALNFQSGEAREIRSALIDAPSRTPRFSEALVRALRDLAVEYHARRPLGEAMIRGLASSALVELARILRSPRSVTQRSHDAEHRIRRFLDQLQQRCDQPLTVESMASVCGLGRSRFNDLVRRLTGDPPRILLNRMRVERAKMMLAQGEATPIQIALSCGFGSQQYFCRVFRAYVGMTPTAFREARDEA